MPLNFTSFFKLERLFHLYPSITLNTIYFLSSIFGALLVLAILIKIIQKISKKDCFYKDLLQKYFIMLTVMGLIGLAWVWFRYERAYFVSARFWFLVWIIGLAVWLGFIFKYQFKTVPESRKKLQKTKEFNKYLPKKK